MELIEVKCVNCGRGIIVLEGYIKKEMFCTLGCLEKSRESSKKRMRHN
jgi:hypothetical protein